MENQATTWTLTATLAGLLLGVLITGLWAWVRQRALQRRMAQLDAARHQLTLHNAAARRQIEQLQKELSDLRLADEREHHRVVHHEPLPTSSASVTPELLPEEEPDRPNDGFAPTQLLNRG